VKEYTWFNGLSDTAPQLETASYRFRPSTGSVSIIDDTTVQPNGIAFSPSHGNHSAKAGQTVYISDTGAISATILQSLGTPNSVPFNTTGKRIIYAYDTTKDGNHIVNKRPIYLAQEGVPDGLKVARNGYVGINLSYLLSQLTKS
jgi:sugar lactone lactonase YvrE